MKIMLSILFNELLYFNFKKYIYLKIRENSWLILFEMLSLDSNHTVKLGVYLKEVLILSEFMILYKSRVVIVVFSCL